jgi:hypothetical protein
MFENTKWDVEKKLGGSVSGWMIAVVVILLLVAIAYFTGLMDPVIAWMYGSDQTTPQSLGGDTGSLPDSDSLTVMRR